MVLVDTQAFGELAYLVSCPICQKSRKFFSQTALMIHLKIGLAIFVSLLRIPQDALSRAQKLLAALHCSGSPDV
jgi:hypothetical protein